MAKIPIAIAYGDGIGPEIMEATLFIFNEAGCPLEQHIVEIGEKAYHRGFQDGMDPKTWDVLRDVKAFFKAPITTPQGGGFKSLNVTIRTTLGLFANVRPCVSYHPFVPTKHPGMNVVIVRENEEDLYCGIEYRQSPQVAKSLKIISHPGSERIVRFAFEYAKRYNRKKVSCMTKDNILKMADGLFHKVFTEIAGEYPEILHEHYIVDIGAARLATEPELFDVVVLPNLYGDILSDVTAQMSGSVGICGSANIGEKGAMFEAIHGSAPMIAGKNEANPSGLLLAGVQMLVHLDLTKYAEKIHNAWLKTLEEGIHTQDIFHKEYSKKKVSTHQFAEAVVANLGKSPTILDSVTYENAPEPYSHKSITQKKERRELVGVDIIIFEGNGLKSFFDKVSHASEANLHLHKISNRGVKMWPEGMPETNCIDQWSLRFINADLKTVSQDVILKLLQDLDRVGIEILSVEHLYTFDGKEAF